MIKPTEIRYIKKTNTLSLSFEDGISANLTTEYLRCFSPSAEVKGHGPGQRFFKKEKKTSVSMQLSQSGIMQLRLYLMMVIIQDFFHGSIFMIYR